MHRVGNDLHTDVNVEVSNTDVQVSVTDVKVSNTDVVFIPWQKHWEMWHKCQVYSNNISSHHVWHCMGYAPCDYGDGLLFAPHDLFIFVMY